MSLMPRLLSDDSHAFFIDRFDQLQNTIHDHETKLNAREAPLGVTANTKLYSHNFYIKHGIISAVNHNFKSGYFIILIFVPNIF